VRLLANENCRLPLFARLRERGHDVVWVREARPDATDEQVFAWARREGRTIMTFDKNFGELAHGRGVAAPSGVILLRIPTPSPEMVADTVANALDAHPGWEVRRDPGPAGYATTRAARGDDAILPLALEGRSPVPLRAADLLPRRPPG
jgi:predicted nuclease of predicted toxin-antitoxin system